MSKYSVVMHELAEINLCLRNLDEAPQSTNQSRHANKAVHPISSHPAPDSTAGRAGSGRHQAGLRPGGGFVCLFTCLPLSPLVVKEITFRKVLCLKVVLSLRFLQSSDELIPWLLSAALPPSCKPRGLLRKGSSCPPPALSALCQGWGRASLG